MTKLILNESEILLDVVEPGSVCMTQHMEVQLPDTGLPAKFLDRLLQPQARCSVLVPCFQCQDACAARFSRNKHRQM